MQNVKIQTKNSLINSIDKSNKEILGDLCFTPPHHEKTCKWTQQRHDSLHIFLYFYNTIPALKVLAKLLIQCTGFSWFNLSELPLSLEFKDWLKTCFDINIFWKINHLKNIYIYTYIYIYIYIFLKNYLIFLCLIKTLK